MAAGPNLSNLSHASLTAQVAALTARLAELEAKLGLPPKTPDNSSVPPSKGQKKSEPSTPKAKANPPRRGASSAPFQPDLRADRVGVCLPRLRLRRFERPAKSLRDLRPDRNPRNPARRDARDLAGRRLPVLRQTLQGPSARRLGAGIAIWAKPSRLRDLSARGPRHSDGPVERRVEGSVRAGHQRGVAGQYSERGPRALHDADEPHQGAAAGGHGVGFGRDGPARRQSQLVALGVPPWRQRRLRGPPPPFQAGRPGLSGRMAARLLAVGSLGQPDGLGYARASVLLGPSHS